MSRQIARRKFIKTTGKLTVGGILAPNLFGNYDPASIYQGEHDIKELFESNREDALDLAERVFQKCILEKIMPPQPPLKHNWVYPGGPYYIGQVNSATRTFTKKGGTALLIEDDIECNENTKYVTWQLITQADVEIVDGGAILKQDGKELKLNQLSHPGIKLDVISLNPSPHKLDKVMENLKRIELKIPVSEVDNSKDRIEIKIKLSGEKLKYLK